MLITLFIALGLGLVLASYLLMIRAQYASVVRSQAWHSALTMAEAGVEEALAQLNATNALPSYEWSSSNNLIGGAYAVSYTPPDTAPTIYATGYATVPTISATIARVVEVKTTLAPLLSVGAAVRGNLKMNGKKLFTDSYDSGNWPYSYDHPNGPRTHGDVAIAGGITNFGTVDIDGRLFLGATATSTGGPNFSVSSNIFTDFNAEFSEVLPPFQSPDRAPQPGTNFTFVLSGYNYQTNTLNGSVLVTASAVLYVTGNANITNLDIAAGASLKLYVGGGSTTFGQVNVDGSPKDFQYYGLPGNTNITMIGYDKFTGIIYAPNARFRAGERFSGPPFYFNDFDLYGAVVTDTIDMRSDLKLHFDENLKNVSANGGPVRGFIVTSWQELPPP